MDLNNEEYDDPDTFGKRQPPAPPLATHCDVALKYSKQRAALGIPAPGQHVSIKNQSRREWQDIKAVAGDPIIFRLENSKIQWKLLNYLEVPETDISRQEWLQQFRISKGQCSATLQMMKQFSNLPMDPIFPALSKEEKNILWPRYVRRCFFEEGVLTSGSKHYTPSQWWTRRSDSVSSAFVHDIEFFVTENLLLIKSPMGNFLSSRDHLLMLADLSSQRYLLSILSIMESKKLEPQFVSLECLDHLLENGDKMLEVAGNEGYKVIYTLEPSCISRMVGNIPVGSRTGVTFKETVKGDSQVKAQQRGVEQLWVDREGILDELQLNPVLLSQVFGLYRIWGHPTLEPLEGTVALKDITTRVRFTQTRFVEEINNKFKEEFIIRFIGKFGKWPLVDVSRLSPFNPIREAYQQKGEYPLQHPKYSRQSLKLLSFLANFPVDPKFDIIEMLADKSMSLNTKELIESLMARKGVGSAIARSVLVQWLKSPHHDPAVFLDLIDKAGFGPYEKSVGVKEKEREGKLEARLFGLMTLYKRLYIVLTEALLAEHILDLFPEITMTDDELALDKKRLQFTDPSLSKRSLYTSLDFSKWNSNMRQEETQGLFTSFDQLFGFKNCFTRTHEMFNDCFFYLLNGSYLPKIVNGQFVEDLGSWTGHLGGIEGLRQKGWTVWTVLLILLAAEDFPLQLRLMGQGDNQILREVFPEDLDDEAQMNVHFDFLERLNLILSEIGPPLKMEETWTSRSLFVYGKYLILNGSPLPMFGKRICRMFRLSNEDFPTLESTISSLTANLSAALSYSFRTGPLYSIYLLELVGSLQLFFRGNYLQKHAPYTVLARSSELMVQGQLKPIMRGLPPLLQARPIQTDNLYHKLILLPRCLGGLPITSYLQQLLRGFPDEVSFAISTLKKLYPFFNPEIQAAIATFMNPILHPDLNFTLLLEHPTAINLEVPSSPGESRRSMVIEFLKTSPRVENPYLKQFLSLLGSPDEKTLINYLATARPMAPRVLSTIAASLVEFRARQVAGKLQKTKTISTLARVEGQQDIYTVIVAAELNHIKSVLGRCQGFRNGMIPWNLKDCSVAHAQKLRDSGWKTPIIGTDCVPPQEFMYLEEKPPQKTCINSHNHLGHIVIRHSRNLTDEELAHPLSLGAYRPYRGSVTRQKVTGYGDKMAAQADPIISNTLKLFSLIGWCVPETGNLTDLIHMIYESKTDLPRNLLQVEYGPGKGSHHHRQQDQRTAHGGSVPLLPNYGTKFGFDTFPLNAYSKGSKNVNLMFQALMGMATVQMSDALSTGRFNSGACYHIHVASPCCVRPVEDQLITCSTVPPPCIRSYPDSPYLFVPKEKLLGLSTINLNFPTTLPASPPGLVSSNRMTFCLAYEIVALLKPLSWTARNPRPATRGLLINWALAVSLKKVMEAVSLFILSSFSPLPSETPRKFLTRIALMTDRSPILYWKQLENLVFCPNVHHEMTQSPYFSLISGNPCLTPEIFAFNLRTFCVCILTKWISTPDVIKGYQVADICSPKECSTVTHPSLTTFMEIWTRRLTSESPIEVRSVLINELQDKHPITLEGLEERGVHQFQKLILIGASKIFGEDCDSLCKECDPPSLPEGHHLSELQLTSASYVIDTYIRKGMIKTSIHLSEGVLQDRVKYASHQHRPIGTPTSGPFKGLSLAERIRSYVTGNVMCLGDGAGGYTWAFLRTFPEIKVFYNSLIATHPHIQQSSPIPYIPSMAGWPQLEGRVVGLDLSNDGPSDITNPEFPDYLKTHLTDTFIGLICDAETPDYLTGDFGVRLVLRLVRIATIFRLDWILVKTYCARPTLFRIQKAILLSSFQKVEVLRSKFSDSGNSEVFLFASIPGKPLPFQYLYPTFEGEASPLSQIEEYEHIHDAHSHGTTLLTKSITDIYTKAVHPEHEAVILSRLYSFLPFLLSPPIIYPHSILQWINQTSTKSALKPSTRRRFMEYKTFPIDTVKKWFMGWLTLAIYALELDEDQVKDILDYGRFMWYTLNDGSWEFSPSMLTPPAEEQGYTCKVYRSTDLLTSFHMKLIYRMLGIMKMINPSVQLRSRSIIRGGLTKEGRNIPEPRRAQSQWIRDNIQQIHSPVFPATDVQRGTALELWEQMQKKKRSYKI